MRSGGYAHYFPRPDGERVRVRGDSADWLADGSPMARSQRLIEYREAGGILCFISAISYNYSIE